MILHDKKAYISAAIDRWSDGNGVPAWVEATIRYRYDSVRISMLRCRFDLRHMLPTDASLADLIVAQALDELDAGRLPRTVRP